MTLATIHAGEEFQLLGEILPQAGPITRFPELSE